MQAVQEKLQMAVKLHQEGQRERAKSLYEEVLEIDPGNVDAVHLLGVLDLQAGENSVALEKLSKAAAMRPGAVNILTNLGTAQRRLGLHEQAIATYKNAIEIDVNHAESYHNLGVALKAQQRIPEAIRSFRRAVELRPGYPEAMRNLTQLEMQSGDWQQALNSSQVAAQQNPADRDAHLRLAECRMKMKQYKDACESFDAVLKIEPKNLTALNGKGLALKSCGDLKAAEATLKQALEVDPKSFPAVCNLGTVYQGLKDYDKAIAQYKKALEINPKSAESHNNIGGALKEKGEIDESLKHCKRALELKPELPSAHCNYASAMQLQGHFDEAIASYEKALGFQADLHEALLGLGSVYAQSGRLQLARNCYSRALFFNTGNTEAMLYRGIIGLLAGDYATAFADYEARWKLPENASKLVKAPRWNGSQLNGQAVLLHAEQGLGDTLQFVRYAALVKQRGGKTVVACQKPLMPLLARMDSIDHLVAQGDKLPPFVSHVPLLSLPGVFETAVDDVPAEVPYLTADPDLVEKWREPITSLPGLKVGIAWQGNPDFKQDKFRSIALKHFAPIIESDGTSVISLQKGFGSEQIAELACGDQLHEFDDLDAEEGAFMDTAAILSHLDLFITSDSAIAHLAGGLGVKTWLLLPYAPDWRWGLEASATGWYPTLHLYRQQAFLDWESVFEDVASDLRKRVKDSQSAREASAQPV